MPSCDGLWQAALVLAVLTLSAGGCRHGAGKSATTKATAAAAVTAATTSPAPSRFEDRAHGFAVAISPGWERKMPDGPQDVLALSGPAETELTIAVPDLGRHVPGLIPLSAVEKGYVQDAGKRLSDVKVTDQPPTSIAGVAARRFAIAGKDKGVDRAMRVLAVARGDTLYIVTGEGPAAEVDAIQSAVDRVATSWTWLKKDRVGASTSK